MTYYMHSIRLLCCTLQFICPAGSKYPQIQISNLRNVRISPLYRSLKRNVNTCKQFCIYFTNLKKCKRIYRLHVNLFVKLKKTINI